MTNPQPLYIFPPIYWWSYCAQLGMVDLLIQENWVKQSLRTQVSIATHQGSQMLSIPTVKKTRKTMKDVAIANTESWQLSWMKTLTTNYNKSPFFEFYIDELENLIKQTLSNNNLSDFNYSCLKWVNEHLDSPLSLLKSNDYTKPMDPEPIDSMTYYQVFEEKQGFIPNLSILDLLFNLGPESGSFILERHPSR